MTKAPASDDSGAEATGGSGSTSVTTDATAAGGAGVTPSSGVAAAYQLRKTGADTAWEPSPGDIVTLSGLVKAPELNGAFGIVESRDMWPPAADRVSVLVETSVMNVSLHRLERIRHLA